MPRLGRAPTPGTATDNLRTSILMGIEEDGRSVALSAVEIPSSWGMCREAPRPPELRPPDYAELFDWKTLFYDVYRVGPHVVFQGPPLRNLLAPLKRDPTFRGRIGWLNRGGRVVTRPRASEVWLSTAEDELTLARDYEALPIRVQPDLSELLAGMRVLLTLSKNNELAWIIDWIDFHRRLHGATAALIYDNASTAYRIEDLRTTLVAAFPTMRIIVVHWPFMHGPRGWTPPGHPPRWDSDFSQTGVFQHARFRFLRHARSVLNADIDELVVSERGKSVFDAAEGARHGAIRFRGRWISAVRRDDPASTPMRHRDYSLVDQAPHAIRGCPTKWCLALNRHFRLRWSWTVHHLVGAPADRRVSRAFTYRHLRAISTHWKWDRRESHAYDPDRFVADRGLEAAYQRMGW